MSKTEKKKQLDKQKEEGEKERKVTWNKMER